MKSQRLDISVWSRVEDGLADTKRSKVRHTDGEYKKVCRSEGLDGTICKPQNTGAETCVALAGATAAITRCELKKKKIREKLRIEWRLLHWCRWKCSSDVFSVSRCSETTSWNIFLCGSVMQHKSIWKRRMHRKKKHIFLSLSLTLWKIVKVTRNMFNRFRCFCM